MERVKAQGSLLVNVSNDFLPCLELMIYILRPTMTRSVNAIL